MNHAICFSKRKDAWFIEFFIQINLTLEDQSDAIQRRLCGKRSRWNWHRQSGPQSERKRRTLTWMNLMTLLVSISPMAYVGRSGRMEKMDISSFASRSVRTSMRSRWMMEPCFESSQVVFELNWMCMNVKQFRSLANLHNLTGNCIGLDVLCKPSSHKHTEQRFWEIQITQTEVKKPHHVSVAAQWSDAWNFSLLLQNFVCVWNLQSSFFAKLCMTCECNFVCQMSTKNVLCTFCCQGSHWIRSHFGWGHLLQWSSRQAGMLVWIRNSIVHSFEANSDRIFEAWINHVYCVHWVRCIVWFGRQAAKATTIGIQSEFDETGQQLRVKQNLVDTLATLQVMVASLQTDKCFPTHCPAMNHVDFMWGISHYLPLGPWKQRSTSSSRLNICMPKA